MSGHHNLPNDPDDFDPRLTPDDFGYDPFGQQPSGQHAPAPGGTPPTPGWNTATQPLPEWSTPEVATPGDRLSPRATRRLGLMAHMAVVRQKERLEEVRHEIHATTAAAQANRTGLVSVGQKFKDAKAGSTDRVSEMMAARSQMRGLYEAYQEVAAESNTSRGSFMHRQSSGGPDEKFLARRLHGHLPQSDTEVIEAELAHAYAKILDTKNEVIDHRIGEKAKAANHDFSWTAEVSPGNVLALFKTIMAGSFIEDRPYIIQRLRDGGLRNIDSPLIPLYLGISPEAWQRQVDDKAYTVPPTVIDKINFLFSLLSDKKVEDGKEPQPELALVAELVPTQARDLAPLRRITNPPKIVAVAIVPPVKPKQIKTRGEHGDRRDRRNATNTPDDGTDGSTTKPGRSSREAQPGKADDRGRRDPKPVSEYDKQLDRYNRVLAAIDAYDKKPEYAALFTEDRLKALHNEIQEEAWPLYEARLVVLNKAKLEELNKNRADADKFASVAAMPASERIDSVDQMPPLEKRPIIDPIDRAHTIAFAGKDTPKEVLSAITLARLVAVGKIKPPTPPRGRHAAD